MGLPIKFYTDEHVPRALVRGVRQRGADVLTVAEADLLGASDEEHFERARIEGRVIFTQDDDFLRLHAAGVEKMGLAPSGCRRFARISRSCEVPVPIFSRPRRGCRARWTCLRAPRLFYWPDHPRLDVDPTGA